MEEIASKDLLAEIKEKPNGTKLTGDFRIRYFGIPKESITFDARDITEDFVEIYVTSENGNCTALHCARAKDAYKIEIPIEKITNVFEYK